MNRQTDRYITLASVAGQATRLKWILSKAEQQQQKSVGPEAGVSCSTKTTYEPHNTATTVCHKTFKHMNQLPLDWLKST